MPGNVAPPNRLFHRLPVCRRCLFQVLKQQPRSRRPHVTPLAALVRPTRNLDRMWKVLIEIFVDYVVLRVDETRIEVALEHHRNPLDCQVRLHRLNLLGSQ